MAHTRKLKSLERPFVVDRKLIEKIAQIFEKHKLDYKAECDLSDGSRITFDNIEELNNFNNTKMREIVQISFRGVEFDPHANERFLIEMRFESYGLSKKNPVFTYEVEGNDSDVQFISSELDEIGEICDAGHPPVVRLLKRNWYPEVTISILCVIFFMSLTFINNKHTDTIEDSSIDEGVNFNNDSSENIQEALIYDLLILAQIGFFAVIFLGGFWFVRKKAAIYFPDMTFLIGDGERRYNKILQKQKSFSTIVLSVIIPILASFLLTIYF